MRDESKYQSSRIAEDLYAQERQPGEYADTMTHSAGYDYTGPMAGNDRGPKPKGSGWVQTENGWHNTNSGEYRYARLPHEAVGEHFGKKHNLEPHHQSALQGYASRHSSRFWNENPWSNLSAEPSSLSESFERPSGHHRAHGQDPDGYDFSAIMKSKFDPGSWSPGDHHNIANALQDVHRNHQNIDWAPSDKSGLKIPPKDVLQHWKEPLDENHPKKIASIRRVVMAHLRKQWENQRKDKGHSLGHADKEQYKEKKIRSPLTGNNVSITTIINEYERYHRTDPVKARMLKPVIDRLHSSQEKMFQSKGVDIDTGQRTPSRNHQYYTHTQAHRDLAFEFGTGRQQGVGHSPDVHETITGKKIDWTNRHHEGWHDQKREEMYGKQKQKQKPKTPQRSVGDVATQFLESLNQQGGPRIRPHRVAQRHLEAAFGGSYMSHQNLQDIQDMAGGLLGHIQPHSELEDWVEDKLSTARQQMSDVHRFYESGQGQDLTNLSVKLAARYLADRDVVAEWQQSLPGLGRKTPPQIKSKPPRSLLREMTKEPSEWSARDLPGMHSSTPSGPASPPSGGGWHKTKGGMARGSGEDYEWVATQDKAKKATNAANHHARHGQRMSKEERDKNYGGGGHLSHDALQHALHSEAAFEHGLAAATAKNEEDRDKHTKAHKHHQQQADGAAKKMSLEDHRSLWGHHSMKGHEAAGIDWADANMDIDSLRRNMSDKVFNEADHVGAHFHYGEAAKHAKVGGDAGDHHQKDQHLFSGIRKRNHGVAAAKSGHSGFDAIGNPRHLERAKNTPRAYEPLRSTDGVSPSWGRHEKRHYNLG